MIPTWFVCLTILPSTHEDAVEDPSGTKLHMVVCLLEKSNLIYTFYGSAKNNKGKVTAYISYLFQEEH